MRLTLPQRRGRETAVSVADAITTHVTPSAPAATTRAVTLVDHQVVQRTEHAAAEVIVRCPRPGSVVARSPQREVRGDVVDGACRILLPVGGPYTVTLHDGGDAVMLADDVLVGDLWVLAGSTNMAGAAPFGDDVTPHPHVRLFDTGGSWRPARDPLHERFDDSLRPRGVGPGLSFGNAMIDERGVPVGLVATASVGSTMADWDPSRADEGDISEFGFLRRSLLLIGGRTAGMIWYLGEADATAEDSEARAADLESTLRDMIREYRRLTGDRTAPVHLVQLGQYVGQHRAEHRRSWIRIRGVQERFAAVGADSVTATADLRLTDTVHLGLEAQRRLGRRLALAASGRPPFMVDRVRVTRSARLILDFVGVSHALLDVGDIVGFSIHDDAHRDVEIVVGARVTGACQVTIELSRPPQPGESLWYGYGTTPYCQLVDASDRAVPCFGPLALVDASDG